MRAVVLTGHGDMDKLEYWTDWPVPRPGPGEVLIKVHACGLNNTDVNTRTGWYSKAVTEATSGGGYDDVGEEDPSWGGSAIVFPRIQGADVAGTVVAVGESADQSLTGKRVMVETWIRDPDDPLDMNKCRYLGSEMDGGFAEYLAIVERAVFPIESELSDAELATFATSWVTAENMLNRAQVTKGDTVLIPGASGGVGSALIQLANRRGATTIAMAGSGKQDAVAALGPHAVLDRAPADLISELKRAIGSDNVTVVADVVGGDYFTTLIDVLARGGRYTCSGAIAGPIVDLDLRTLYLNDLTFTGATVVPPGTFGDLVGYIERDEVRPVLAQAFPLEKLHDAQQAFIDKKHVGNIVVTMG
ncbi:MAG: zinc-binding dehydrogenase [Hyphomicrobiales bacterium]|nr:zinc-binding dehydrogenase [Hyphomicrobiales bacterium]MCP5001429.1 zinc-binding dehydrogenase [Hyphomicrobiales bacterium]